MNNTPDPHHRTNHTDPAHSPGPLEPAVTVELPFRCATAFGDRRTFVTAPDATTSRSSRTHLVLHSPQMSQHGPDDLHAVTLCARPSSTPADDRHPADVDCLECLGAAQHYLHWPTFTTGGNA